MKDVTSRDTGKKGSKKTPKKKRRRIIQDTEDTQGDKNDYSAFNLKLASNLMMGTARIWRSQVDQLYEESKLMVSKQATYNAFIQAETIEEERRNARVNGEKPKGGKTKSGKKKTSNIPTQFRLDDFEQFQESIVKGHEQNKVFEELTLNTAHNDQITIRETNLQLPTTFPLSMDNEMGLNDFEPVDQEDIDFFFEGDAMIDIVREAPIEDVPHYGMSDSSFEDFPENDLPEAKIREVSPVHMNELIGKEIENPTLEEPIEMQFEQQSLVVEEPHEDFQDPEPEYNENDVDEFHSVLDYDHSRTITPIPLPLANTNNKREPEYNENEVEEFQSVLEDDPSRTIDPIPLPQVNNKRAIIVRPSDPFAMHLSRLSKESLTALKVTKAKRGHKRKIDAVTKISKDSMVHQMEDTSDIVQPATPLPPLKKFRFATPALLLKQPSHSWRAFVSDCLTHDFALKVKFLSLSEKTRKRKLKDAAKNDIPNKRLRRSHHEPVLDPVPPSRYAELETTPPKARLDVRPKSFIPEPVVVFTSVHKKTIAHPSVVPLNLHPEPNLFVSEPIPTSGYEEMVAPREIGPEIHPEPNSFVPEPVSYPVHTSVHEEMVAPQEIAPEVLPPPEPPMPEPVLDHILNELREEEALAESPDEQSNHNTDVEASQWKRVKENWGQIPLLKKLITIFRNKRLGWPTVEMLIEQERNRKVGTVTFSSLIRKF